MRLAIVAGLWHAPAHFYSSVSRLASGADLFAVAHRSPDLAIVREEKRETLETLPGRLGDLDRELYAEYVSMRQLKSLNWQYQEEANTCGDWGYLNQWLMTHDYRKYDAVLFMHDDTYIWRESESRILGNFLSLFDLAISRWLVIGHSKYEEAPQGYLRGSFECFSRELLVMLGGSIPLGDPGLSRKGLIDTPKGMEALSPWNATCEPLRRIMVKQRLTQRILYLSEYYRVSPWIIEGERGLLSNQGAAPWSFQAGLKAYPI